MADLDSPITPLTIHLPADLIAELRLVAEEKGLSVDEVVREACLAYTEPRSWERDYKEWLREHPDQPRAEFGIDGDDLTSQRAGA
ncbi:MAG TPA: ribbon-helix-helix protein, CopG family [Gemmataceae bacterium]|nr:ribbon-helix-helix protein, CopG family [Gemmataceae bacterium]